jgi:hypothetical protein
MKSPYFTTWINITSSDTLKLVVRYAPRWWYEAIQYVVFSEASTPSTTESLRVTPQEVSGKNSGNPKIPILAIEGANKMASAPY